MRFHRFWGKLCFPWILFFPFTLLTFSCGADLPHLKQFVQQEGLQINVPSTWDTEKLPLLGDMGYSLLLLDEKEENTLNIMVMNMSLPLEEVFSMSQEILTRNQVMKNMESSAVLDGKFKTWDSREMYFIGQAKNYLQKAKGKTFSFTTGSKSYIIIYVGEQHFDQNLLIQKILSTLETPNSIVKDEEMISKRDWNTYTIADIAEIKIPSTLELRDQDAYISLKAKHIRKKFREQGKLLEKSEIVFQTSGTNEASEGEFEEYGRILIDYEFGEPGDFFKWNEDLIQFEDAAEDLGQSLKEEITSPMSQLNIRLIEWFPVEYSKKNEEGLSYFKVSYLRQMGSNPVIKTERYNFFNDSEAVTITLSYRVKERPLWASDFQKVIDSFNFITRYN